MDGTGHYSSRGAIAWNMHDYPTEYIYIYTDMTWNLRHAASFRYHLRVIYKYLFAECGVEANALAWAASGVEWWIGASHLPNGSKTCLNAGRMQVKWPFP